MKYCEYVMVILTFRNSNDLEECLLSVRAKIKSCKVIIVNSYYGDISKNEIKQLAKKYDCVFLNIENKGYSYGNNRGIEYASDHYDFSWIIVANLDTCIKKFPAKNCFKGDVIAPKIVTINGKNQNPMNPKRCRIAEKCIYNGFKENSQLLFFFGIAINAVSRLSVNSYLRAHREPFSGEYIEGKWSEVIEKSSAQK